MYSLETRRAYGGYVSGYQADAREAWWTSMPVWTGCVIGVGGLFHPTGVPGCQALFVCMGAAMVGMGCLVAWRRPLRSTPGVWFDAASRVCFGAIMFCMAAALVDGGTAREPVEVVVYALVVVQLVLVALRVVHLCVCWYVDAQIAGSSLPLETVWTHIPGRDKKVTQRFLAEDSEVLLELSDVAKDRDNEGDVAEMASHHSTTSDTESVSTPVDGAPHETKTSTRFKQPTKSSSSESLSVSGEDSTNSLQSPTDTKLASASSSLSISSGIEGTSASDL